MRTLMMSAIAAVVLAMPAMAEEKAMDHGKLAGQKMMDHSKMDHGPMAKPVEASGVGVINSVDREKGTINITHEPMPELGWPTMTMDMPVTKRVDLGAVKPGDQVDFKVKLGRDKQYRVMEMEAVK